MGNKKRGISPLIATVLLIGFIVALVAVVMMWGKGFVMEKAQKEGSLADKQLGCTRVKIDIKKEGNSIFVLNSGSEPIDGLILRQLNIVKKCRPGSADCSGFTRLNELDRYDLSNVGGLSGGKNTDVIPALIPEGAGAPLVPCSEQMKTILG